MKEALPVLLCLVAHSCLTPGPCGFPGRRPRGVSGRPHLELLAPWVFSAEQCHARVSFLSLSLWRLTSALWVISLVLFIPFPNSYACPDVSVRSAVSDNPPPHAHTHTHFLLRPSGTQRPLGLLHSFC